MQREAGITRRLAPDSKAKLVTYGLSRAAKMAFKRLESIDIEDLLSVSGNTDKDMQAATKELRTRYRQNMMNNAQLDNEKQALTYNVEDLQDQVEERNADNSGLENELKVWNRNIEEERRRQAVLDEEIERLTEMISDRDDVIKECGFQLVSSNDRGKNLLSEDCLSKLQLNNITSCALDGKLRSVLSENSRLNKQLKQAKLDLEVEREGNSYCRQTSGRRLRSPTMLDLARLEREQCQKVADCKREVNNTYLRIDSLENQLIRLEAQILRYRGICEDSEKVQTQVKAENRRASKQLEELVKRADELTLDNKHLETRLDKVRQVRESALSQSRR